MKKKIGYLLLIIISIVGSRLIFGKDYHLNSSNLTDTNLYVYDIFGNENVTLTMVDNENLYYVLSSGTNNKMQYSVIKYNLISDKIVNEYRFNTSNVLNGIKMFKEDDSLYLTALNSNIFYMFNKNLELIDQKSTMGNYESYVVLNNDFITTLNNQVYKDNGLYNVLPNSCGKVKDVIYSNDTYIHFHNSNTGFGCLYNLNTREREYLDYSNMDIVKGNLLEYQDNRLSFKYDDNLYYFNDIAESNHLKMHENGDYLFTINNSNNILRIYNLDTERIIYERIIPGLVNSKIDNILIDDYAYFTIKKDNTIKLYIWDYLKESRNNKSMVSFNEKEYKFKNNELREEINNKYNVDVYIYDQAVTYFPDYYVISSNDDILINSRLVILRDMLSTMDNANLDKLSNTKICFEKNIVSNNLNDNYNIISTNKDNSIYIAIDITNDNFKSILLEKINNLTN